MKRSERNKVKTESDQRHSDPHHTEADNHERHISGSINVRGEIETKRPPDLTQEHATERKQDNAREKKKFVLEIGTLVVVGIYAGLTFWQGCINRDLLKVSRDTFNAANRPYVGQDTIATNYLWWDEKTKTTMQKPVADPQATSVNFQFNIKNFGPVPGSKFHADFRAFFGGVEIPMKGIPATPSTIYPSQSVHLDGFMQGPEYQALIRGTKKLNIQITIEYDGPSGHYKECQEHQFVPQVGFAGLGDCPPR